MSEMTLLSRGHPSRRPLVWLHGEVRSPPFSVAARREAGFLLRRLQRGESIGLPHARPMPSIAARCVELRIVDVNTTWRLIVRPDPDLILILAVFAKKTQRTPAPVLDACRRRLRALDAC